MVKTCFVSFSISVSSPTFLLEDVKGMRVRSYCWETDKVLRGQKGYEEAAHWKGCCSGSSVLQML